MTTSGDDVSHAVLHEAGRVLDDCLAKIKHCLGQLSEEQVWWRPLDSMNAIGNLVLHLTGNVRQWMVSGIGGSADVRNRPAEFSEKGPVSRATLLEGLEKVVAETKAAFSQATAASMSSPRRIQGFTVTGWAALFDSVPHFKGHTQEIICYTRLQLKDAYKFHWRPETVEQGAPTA
jgi:hypothetical protein